MWWVMLKLRQSTAGTGAPDECADPSAGLSASSVGRESASHGPLKLRGLGDPKP